MSCSERIIQTIFLKQELPSPKTNMYPRSKKQWNVYSGCLHGCIYCVSSFQRQLKRWAKNHCQQCYEFTPHFHPERLDDPLPKTGKDEFISVGLNGDWAFTKPEWREAILQRIRDEVDKTFLIQSKNPKIFQADKFSSNVILGTTIETNRTGLYLDLAHAPLPLERVVQFYLVEHPRKMITHEPIIDFDIDTLASWDQAIKPELIWVGYDSKQNYLPEPELARTQLFIEELKAQGFQVVEKLLRKAWWEKD